MKDLIISDFKILFFLFEICNYPSLLTFADEFIFLTQNRISGDYLLLY